MARILGAASLLLGASTACGGSSGGSQAGAGPTLASFAGVVSGEGFADGPGAQARLYQPSAVVLDPQDNLLVADFQNHTIRKITPAGVVTTLAGIPGVPGSTNGAGAAALFNFPAGLATDAAGNVFVADSNNLIRMVTPAGVVSPVSGTAGVAGSANGPGANALFNNPGALALDGQGNLYVADTGNNTIRKLAPSQGAWTVSTLAGTAGTTGSTNGTGPAASFNNPAGLAVDGSGNLFVADTGNQILRKITPLGVVTLFAGTAGVTGAADGTVAAASFRSPYGLAVNGSGTVYAADFYNNTIRAIDPSGSVSTLAGRPGAPGFRDGPGLAAWFNHPGRLAVDAAGNAYVPDSYNNVLRKITPAGVVTLLAGMPGVADSRNNTIRKISPAGVVSTFAGTAGTRGSADGAGAAASFNLPADLATDPSGNIYVTDFYNGTIRAISPGGVVTTLAGVAGAGRTGLDNLPPLLSDPFGIAVDPSTGNLLVSLDDAILRLGR
jgi:sugar lactone lactonase YvrE